MKITVIASSSRGNCSLIEHEDHKLLLDAGLPVQKIRLCLYGLDCSLTDLDGVLISHEHMDHARAVRDLAKLGIDCFMSQGTRGALSITGHRIFEIKSHREILIGPWKIMPFNLVHDAAEPLGFLVSAGTEKLLYATDTAYIPYVFQGLTHIMVECNHSLEIINQGVKEGALPPLMKHRLMTSHMGLETFKRFILANDMDRVQEIWLMHLSDARSDAEQFRAEVQGITGKVVKVA